MATNTHTYSQYLLVHTGSGRSSLARSDTASSIFTLLPRSWLLRPPREDVLKICNAERMKKDRWCTLPVREGPLRMVVWKIIGLLQGYSPEGISPPILNDARRYVLIKTRGNSVSI